MVRGASAVLSEDVRSGASRLIRGDEDWFEQGPVEPAAGDVALHSTLADHAKRDLLGRRTPSSAM